jgi:hypothetical protein
MLINFDENQLISQKIDLDSTHSITHQILRLTAYHRFYTLEFYSQIHKKFEAHLTVNSLIKTEQILCSNLMILLDTYHVKSPINSWKYYINLPQSLLECCEVIVAAEINQITLYNHLLTHVQQADIQDCLFRLQAASHNDNLPTLRTLINHNRVNHSIPANELNEQDFSGEELNGKIEEYKALFESMMSGQIDQAELGKLLSNSNMALIGGLLMGGLGTMLFNNMPASSDESAPNDCPTNTKENIQ